ncbi:grpE protein2, mitochondrial-like [Scleropages formosus]|uniref:GrpE protein2, mitochondrial-like n=1 Tax=Scleropages formosus TaxID=113540 RepID=A0A0P7VMI1_SCLFO|nr:grpE protein homolog 2, mitochondrial [Scleropages formosus]KPP77226.1 grpE protein2, mitochondrial-like [Scleropages formosus]
MAIRYLRLAQRNLQDLSKVLLLLPKNNSRTVAELYSTAAQRSRGDDFHGEDGVDDHSHSLTEARILKMRANKLEQEVRDLSERYKKALADSDMVRRRTQKFVEDAKLFGIQSFCRDLVEVADVLERATRDFQGEGLGPEGSTQLCKELVHVLDKLQFIFAKHGLEKMNPVGGRYDPYEHEIVCHVASDGVEPGSVALVKQDGYKLHGRTIRHAHVGIAMHTQVH